MKDKYFVYFKVDGIVYKQEILFATCNVNYKFAGTGLNNVHQIIEQKKLGLRNKIWFSQSKSKLSNLGEPYYISLQDRADIITMNDEVIYSSFEGDKYENDTINYYLKTAIQK